MKKKVSETFLVEGGRVADEAALQAFVKAVGPVYKEFGGETRQRLRGEDGEVLVTSAFPDAKAVERMMASPQYAALLTLRGVGLDGWRCTVMTSKWGSK